MPRLEDSNKRNKDLKIKTHWCAYTIRYQGVELSRAEPSLGMSKVEYLC